MTVVAVTGASGFVGGSVVARLTADGHECIALGRRPTAIPHRMFSLGPAPAAGTFDDVDCLVHCAWDLTVRSPEAIYERNVTGSVNLLRAAVRAGVRRIVFVSSMSAYAGTAQQYGRSKLDVERAVSEAGGTSLRLGLVWGTEAGGMAGAVQRLAALPVVPLLGRASYQFTVHRDDVEHAMSLAVRDPSLTGVLGVAHPDRVPLPRLLDALGHLAGTRTGRLVPVPWRAVYWAMRAAELARIPLPLRADSVLGLTRPAPEVPAVDVWAARGLSFAALPGP